MTKQNQEEEIIVSPILTWLDFETTGFDEDRDVLLEVTMIITDNELNELDGFTSLIVDVDPDRLIEDGSLRTKDDQIPCWGKHWETGLIDELKAACDADALLPTLGEVQENLISLLNAHGVYEGMEMNLRPPLCGSTIGFDRRFLRKHMPNVNRLLHYRSVDVSTIRELQKRWRPDLPSPPKAEAHRTEQDVRESIGYLKNFRDSGFIG
jgi:oligoribonuclease